MPQSENQLKLQAKGQSANKNKKQAATQNSLPAILVADDDFSMRTCVKELLAAYDYQCTLAENGKQALDLLAEQHFDILLLDLMMPEVNGHEVMRRVKDSYPDLDMIIVSGDATFNNATQALRLGAKDFIKKPYTPEDLIKSVRHIDETRQLKNKIGSMHQQILASEQRYRFFINHSPDVIYMLDKKGHFAFVNTRVQELLGYAPEELVGKHYSNFFHADDLPQVSYIFAQNEQFPNTNYNMEFRLIPKNRSDEIRCFESDSIAINMLMSDLYLDEQGGDQIFSGIYGVARDITEKKKHEKQITFQLYHDALTALPNRVLFKDRMSYALNQASRNSTRLAVLFMDMDRFKIINDSLGHTAGDTLLRSLALRLNGCLRESDTLARIGGDEFLLLMPEVKSPRDVEILIHKMQTTLEAPFVLDGHEVFASFSIGVSFYPEDGQTADTLIKHADMAMYQSKRDQKGTYQFFSQHLITQFEPNLAIENGIRKAIAEDQFEVYFQPQVDVKAHRISGVEALIRWNHPEKGMVMPNQFIPLAEETGLICDIGNWMLEASMRVLSQWNQNPSLQHITLAINISAVQFAQEDFVDFVLKTMQRYQISGKQIELEITENVLVQNIQQVVAKLNELGQHGIRFAIDDFGMGYSSLSYLHELPLNNLKIDRSFLSSIQSPTDTCSIISAIVSMAQEMDMTVVAEGVENEIQLNYIRDIGCPVVQGYYFARPMPVAEAKSLALSHIQNEDSLGEFK